ncbi:MAG: M48 family metalloprotease [Archaeoglobaceae archaeon]|nr:M48 family metalloprotease [Archaeoglobaceae archaeon]MCX8151649.1 M48 family metalloprotease [Archaeoglobaceae archaeon]MDW8013073.1 M48 family metalloprotease [Archaeoglobaceae archaeon]
MFLIFDPIYWILAIAGYLLMFALATLIAPKVANKVSGRFSLHVSMVLLAILILAISASVIYLILSFAGVVISFIGLLIFLVIVNLLIYLVSPYMINLSFGAKSSEELQAVVNSVAQRLKVKPPKAVVVSSPPNAFAYGNFLTGKYVAVSDSLMRMLTKEELEAVVGHEIGHHKHRDNLVMLFFGLLPSIIFYLGYALIHAAMHDERRGLQLAAVGLAAVVISFIVQILVLAFSRLREYYADFEGTFAAGKEAMQRSLAKIFLFYHRYPQMHDVIADNKFRTLFIYAFANAAANPLTRGDIERIKSAKVSAIEEFLSTHPPIPKRLKFIDTIKL